jgi:SSS family solute:Na+ symporter
MVIGVGVLATPSYRQRIYSAKTVSSVRQSFDYRPAVSGLLLPAGDYRYGGMDHEPAVGEQRLRLLVCHQVLPPVLAMAI